MSVIDGSRFAEFLDDNKNRDLNRESLRNDISLLKKAGLLIPENMAKPRKKIRALEYFLLRSQLYKSAGENLEPFRISDFWSDYAKSWIIYADEKQIHLPFLGRIIFLCSVSGQRKYLCHPESSSMIEKIFVDTGALTFQKDPDGINLMYRRKSCKAILDAYKQKRLNEDLLQQISDKPFGRALASIGLARKTDTSFLLEGEGLLLDEMKNIKTEDDFEKVARLILRHEQRKKAQISSVIACLELLERSVSPSETPVGSGPRYRKSEKTKRRYERLGHHQVIEGICSIDSRTAANILGKTDPYAAFAAFGAFVESYDKTGIGSEQDWVETYSFLSWLTDSFAFIKLPSETLQKKLRWHETKRQKTERHQAFLERSMQLESLRISSPAEAIALMKRLDSSEIIDMNIDPDSLPEHNRYNYEYCPSNVFISSDVPVNRALFESTVLGILNLQSKLKDSQGTFYYPDFRFLVASSLGMSLRRVDKILAYVISTGSELGKRLWFFPAFGRVPVRDQPDQQLIDVILKPFDSITLNY